MTRSCNPVIWVWVFITPCTPVLRGVAEERNTTKRDHAGSAQRLSGRGLGWGGDGFGPRRGAAQRLACARTKRARAGVSGS